MDSPFLILHGWGSCAKNWEKVKELLEKQGYKVFLPDLPGFGKSSPPEQPWSLDDYIAWVADFCEKNNLSPSSAEQGEGEDGSRNSVHLTPRLKPRQTKFQRPQIFLLGHSFGGGLAVKLVLKYPQIAKKLFLVSPAIIRKKSFKKELIKKLSKLFFFLPEKIKEIIFRKIIKGDYYQCKKEMKKTFLKIIEEDLSCYLSEINLPAVIIWGEKDRITPIKDAYIVNQKIKNSELKIIQNCAHVPNLECPEKLTEIILSFL